MGISSAALKSMRELFFSDRGFKERVGLRDNSPCKVSGAIMFTSMFWLNFAGGTAFVLLGATFVVMIGALAPCDRR